MGLMGLLRRHGEGLPPRPGGGLRGQLAQRPPPAPPLLPAPGPAPSHAPAPLQLLALAPRADVVEAGAEEGGDGLHDVVHHDVPHGGAGQHHQLHDAGVRGAAGGLEGVGAGVGHVDAGSHPPLVPSQPRLRSV